ARRVRYNSICERSRKATQLMRDSLDGARPTSTTLPTSTNKPPSRPSLGKDVRGGLLYAAGLSILALIIIGAEGVSSAAGIRKVSDWDQLPGGLLLIVAGFFMGGTLGGFAFWALRPLRRTVLGWALTGFVIGALAYGAIGLTGVL